MRKTTLDVLAPSTAHPNIVRRRLMESSVTGAQGPKLRLRRTFRLRSGAARAQAHVTSLSRAVTVALAPTLALVPALVPALSLAASRALAVALTHLAVLQVQDQHNQRRGS